MNARHWLVVALLLGLVGTSLSARATGASQPTPTPTTKACARDADCLDCERCRDGHCASLVVEPRPCMCNAECELMGRSSCDLSVDKPLCGGVCVSEPSTRELTCSTGDDAPALVPFTGAIRAADGVVVLPADPLAIEVFP